MNRRSLLAILASIPAAVALPATVLASYRQDGVGYVKREQRPTMTFTHDGVEHTLVLSDLAITAHREITEIIQGYDDDGFPTDGINTFGSDLIMFVVDISFLATSEAANAVYSIFMRGPVSPMKAEVKTAGGNKYAGEFDVTSLDVTDRANGTTEISMKMPSRGALTVSSA